jgi:tetratricopeptide (TPR) repeat protein/serine/threonine protein kinase
MTEPSLPEESIFAQALEITSAAERAAFLDRACGKNPALRAEVEALLRAHEHSSDLLDLPANSAATTDLPSRERPGAVIGPYKLLEPIGEGGMGTVWMAEQTEPIQRRVALKVVKEGMDSRQVLARFEAERQALALMEHPNIARVLDAGRTPSGRPFFVMELVKGQPITKYCDEKRLGVRQRLELFGDVCRAVQHAHQKGIIHRDLKPSNVLVAPYDGKPVVKVIDFGVAKAAGQRLTDLTLFTGFGALVGTPEYMSPEQAEVNNQDIDTRSDIYSLGVLLYELLTGSTPLTRQRLKEAALLEVLRVIREEEPPRPSTRLSESKDSLPSISAQRQTEPAKLTRLVRGELDWIAMKALEKDRNRRYETANGFALDVQRYLADEPVLACPPSVGYRLRKFVRRNKTALAVASLVLFFMAVLGGGGGWVVRDRAAREQEADKERREREAALKGEVNHAAVEAGKWNEQGIWPRSQAALERAVKLLASAGRRERPARLTDLQKDLDMGRRLEEISREPPRDLPTDLTRLAFGVVEGELPSPSREEAFFWFRDQDAQFANAFRKFDVDIDALEPPEAAARLRRTSIRKALVEALDEWAALRRHAWGDKDARWRKLVAITRQVDPDPRRDEFRRASLKGDRQALRRFAETVPLLVPRKAPPATLWLLGNELMEQGYPDQAMACLKQAQHQYPDDYRINETLGWFIRTASVPPRYDVALVFYKVATSLRPRSPRAHRAVAEVLMAIRLQYVRAKRIEGTELFEQAIAEYSRIIELTPDDARAWIERGNAYSQAAQYANAVADYSKAIQLDPKNGWAHYCLGRTLWNKLKDDSPKGPPVQGGPGGWHAGIAYVVLPVNEPPVQGTVQVDWNRMDPNRVEEVLAKLRQAIRLKPEYEPAHALLGNVLRLTGRLDKGIALYREAIRLRPEEARYHYYLGGILAAKALPPKSWASGKETSISLFLLTASDKGWLQKAVGELEEAVRIKKDWQAAYTSLHTARRRADQLRGEWDEVKCREAIRLQPDDWWARIRLCDILHKKDQWKELIAELKRALRLRMDDNTIRLHLCFYLRLTGRLDEAIAEYREAMLREPNNANLHCHLGETLHEKGQLDEAIAEYWKSTRLDPHEEGARSGLGRALVDKGQWDEALAVYRAFDQARLYFSANGQRKVGEEIRRVERLAQLDARLQAILAGKDRPRDAGERCACAILCARPYRRQYAAAARFYREAFTVEPKLAGREGHSFIYRSPIYFSFINYSTPPISPGATNLYAAARAAALAGCGRGDAAGLDEKERAQLRRQALDWLRADWETLSSISDGNWVTLILRRHDAGEATIGFGALVGDSWVAIRMGEWLADSSFAGVRGRKALAKLPEVERQAWQKFWADVTDLRNRRSGKTDPRFKQEEEARIARFKQEQEARIAPFRQAIARNPKNPSAYLNLGRALLGQKAGRSGGEPAAYLKALELYPRDADAHFVVGQALMWKGTTAGGTKDDLEAALTVLKKAIELAPTNAEALCCRGQVYRQLYRWYEAVLDLDKAIHLSPKYLLAYLFRADVHRQMRQWDRARADYSRFLEQLPKDTGGFSGAALCGRGIAHQNLGLWAQAVSDYRKAIQLTPNYIFCEKQLAWLLVSCPEPKLQDPRWAVKWARKVMKVEKGWVDSELWLTLGVAEYRTGDWKAAVATLDKARELTRGGDPLPLFFLAMAHKRLGHNGEARKWYDQAMGKITPSMTAGDLKKNDELRRFRLEAEEALELKKK